MSSHALTATAEVSRSSAPIPSGTGRLRNGNPPGDLRLAARCGARTRRHAACRQPAMKNGRCRLHGGKSTGPRTPAGLARSRRARWVHGARSREFAALRAEGVRIRRRIRALCDQLQARGGRGATGAIPALDPAPSPVGMGSIVANRGGGGCFSPSHRHPTALGPLNPGTGPPAAPGLPLDGHLLAHPLDSPPQRASRGGDRG